MNELLLSGSVNVPDMSKDESEIFPPRLGKGLATVLFVVKEIESVAKLAVIETSAEVMTAFPFTAAF